MIVSISDVHGNYFALKTIMDNEKKRCIEFRKGLSILVDIMFNSKKEINALLENDYELLCKVTCVHTMMNTSFYQIKDYEGRCFDKCN